MSNSKNSHNSNKSYRKSSANRADYYGSDYYRPRQNGSQSSGTSSKNYKAPRESRADFAGQQNYSEYNSPLSLKSLKGLKSGVFSDGQEHLFSTQDLHLSSGSMEDDVNILPDLDVRENYSNKKNSHRNDSIRYNPNLDTDINFNGTMSDYDPDSIFASRANKNPPGRKPQDSPYAVNSYQGSSYPDMPSHNGPQYSEDDLHLGSSYNRGGHDCSPYNNSYNYFLDKKAKRKTKKKLIITFSVIAVIIAVLVVCFFFAKSEVNGLKSQAYVLKDSLKVTFEAVKDLDPDAVENSLANVDAASAAILETLDKPFWKTVAKIGPVETDINTIKGLVNTLKEAKEGIFKPFIVQMRTHPMSELKVDGGFNTSVILSYLDFFDQVSAEIDNISNAIKSIEFKTIKVNAFDEYADKFAQMFSAFDIVKDYSSLLRAIIGEGENRLYLVMAQNSAEIRASGGFPGSMGTIRIQDGILSIGEFSSVLDYIYSPILEASGITHREYELFGYMYGTWAHDACYNMHFSRVAEITRVAYEYVHYESLDGIISLTPVVIQRLLKIAGKSITLSDGTVLDGDNATRILQHDIYYTYQSDDSTAQDNNIYIDPLFNETAKKTMQILTEDFDYTKLADYLDFFKTGFTDRTIMLWFSDSEDEQVAIDAGCSGNLNSDPEKPVTGIYFSLSDPGKLGMFISIDMEITDSKKLDDGSTEYTVEAHYTNTITDADMNAGTWLLGNYGGAIQCSIYLTAPMGGTIYDLEDNSGVTFTLSDYQGVELYYAQYIYIYPGYPVTTRFKVTTAPGATAPLTLEKTPTLQGYLN